MSLKAPRGRGRGGSRGGGVPYNSRPPRGGPRLTDNPAAKLYVGNLDHRITEAQLCKIFSKYGELNRVDFIWRPDGKPAGFCFVIYKVHTDAVKAQFEVNGRLALGRRLNVSFAENNPQERQKKKEGWANRKSLDVSATSTATRRLLAVNVPIDATADTKIQAIQAQLNRMKESGTLAQEFTTNTLKINEAQTKGGLDESSQVPKKEERAQIVMQTAEEGAQIVMQTAEERAQFLREIEMEMEVEMAKESNALTKEGKAIAQDLIRKLKKQLDATKADIAAQEAAKEAADKKEAEEAARLEKERLYGPVKPPSADDDDDDV
eukprot:CFRG2696T1